MARGDSVAVVTNDSMKIGTGVSIENGIEIIRLPCNPLLNGRLPLPRKNAKYKRLLAELGKRKWDGVLVNTRLFPLSLEGLRFAKEQGLTAVVLDHGSAYLSFNQPVLDFFVRRYEDAITAIVKSFDPVFYGISAKSVEWLRHFGIEAEGVISNSINADEYRSNASERDYRAELAIPYDALMVAFVGRLIPEKGIKSLVEASCSDEMRSRGIVFVLAGDGPLAKYVEGATSHYLHWLGRCSVEDTSALLQQADVLCLPSRSEGFSTVLLEASASGTPSVVTDVGGARELIPDEEHGIIINSMKSRDIIYALCRLNDDRELLGLQVASCKALVEERYSWGATASLLETAILNCLKV